MRTVIFVCVHNAGRSQMAAAFFNQLAGNRARAISAGTAPGDAVNPVVVQAMKEVGIDISAAKPQMLTLEMAQDAEKMITMGCGADAGAVCPASFIETEDWQLDDPAGQPIEIVRRIRDDVKSHVELLLKEMKLV